MPDTPPSNSNTDASLTAVNSLALEIVEIGRRTGLAYIAASADVSDPAPMRDPAGKPYAETLFKWFDPKLHYWNDRTFALRSGFIQAARICAEPFFYDGQKLHSWRPNQALDAFNAHADYDPYGVASAVICPCYMPFGVIGTVVWATNERSADIEAVFAENASEMQRLSLHFLSAYRENISHPELPEMVELTRREIQCLKWAALGKTDSEIGSIVGISVPTVRFHLTNSGQKLGVVGRAQAVRVATNMGYIGQSSA